MSRLGVPAGGPLQEAVSGCLERHRRRPAVVGGGRTPAALSYEDLGRRAHEAAARLGALFGGGAGDGGGGAVPAVAAVAGTPHVGFCLGNGVEYVTLYLGTLFAGGLPLLLDANFNTGEIAAIRGDCGLDALVVERARAEQLDLPARGEPLGFAGEVVVLPLARAAAPSFQPRPSTQVCRFTSGSTGRPKCLEFSGEAVVLAARNWVLGTAMSGDDRTLCLAALSNGLAFNTSLLSTFLAGGELHFLAGTPLTRAVAGRVAAAAITRLVAFPALFRNFAAPGGPAPEALASLRHAISAGAPLWPDVREEFRARYGLDISDYYGIAETGPCTFERDPGHHVGLGQPLPGVEIRIAPPPDGAPGAAAEAPAGEVLVRTASMASGYLNHPGLFEKRIDADGFYHSGDRGRIVDGRLHLVGRTEDHINVAGRKIDPAEIVALVTTLEGVAEAVAFADEDLNREALVHLVVVAPHGGVSRAAVVEACRSRLAPYKVPGRISFVAEIPRNGIGKPRIGLLREQLRAAEPPATSATPAAQGQEAKEATP
jgi:acyl-CoA synthetase (AMP-forming)/AMP-acid ligase II